MQMQWNCVYYGRLLITAIMSHGFHIASTEVTGKFPNDFKRNRFADQTHFFLWKQKCLKVLWPYKTINDHHKHQKPENYYQLIKCNFSAWSQSRSQSQYLHLTRHHSAKKLFWYILAAITVCHLILIPKTCENTPQDFDRAILVKVLHWYMFEPSGRTVNRNYLVARLNCT